MGFIETGDWSLANTPELRRFEKIRAGLSVVDKSLVLRQTRIVLPDALQQKAIDIAHNSHQGAAKTTQLLRTKVWFTHMSKLVEQTVRECIPCQCNTPEKNNIVQFYQIKYGFT
jgi:hypothetical protein